MGYVLYVPKAPNVPSTSQKPLLSEAAQAHFWQSSLGKNVLRIANGSNTTHLHVPAGAPAKQMKKALWLQIKALRKAT